MCSSLEELMLPAGGMSQGSRPYPSLPLEGLLQLQVLPSFAGQVHPFPLEPFDRGLSEKIFRLDFGYEGDVGA